LKETFKVLVGFFKKEFAQSMRDPAMRILLLAAPVLQLSLFGYAISNEFKNMTIAVVVQPGDALGRQLADRFYSSRKWFVPARGVSEGEDPEAIVQSGKANAVLLMPRYGLTRDAGKGDAELQLIVDAENATRASIIESYATSIVREFTADTMPQSVPRMPIHFTVRTLFNPTMEASYFFVPGVMTMLILLATILMTGMSIAREKELGTFETIIAAPLKRYEIILGKTIPYAILGMVNATLVIIVGVVLFGVPIRGSLVAMFIAMLVFVMVTTGIGTLISTIARNQQQAMMGTFLIIFPFNMMAGVFYPIESMPAMLKVFAYLDPLMYAIKIFRNIFLKGANPALVWPNIGVLAVMAFLVISFAVYRFHQKLD
jgi:ABC-2 type transport system permease protein